MLVYYCGILEIDLLFVGDFQVSNVLVVVVFVVVGGVLIFEILLVIEILKGFKGCLELVVSKEFLKEVGIGLF